MPTNLQRDRKEQIQTVLIVVDQEAVEDLGEEPHELAVANEVLEEADAQDQEEIFAAVSHVAEVREVFLLAEDVLVA